MKSAVLCLVIFYLLKGGNAVNVWEFGADEPGSIVVSQSNGFIRLTEKTKYVQLSVPPCVVVTYVRVEVDNPISTPMVTFNNYSNSVTIAYKLLQLSTSTYSVTANGVVNRNCRAN